MLSSMKNGDKNVAKKPTTKKLNGTNEKKRANEALSMLLVLWHLHGNAELLCV